MKLRIPRSSLTIGLSLVGLTALISACGGSTTTSPQPIHTPTPVPTQTAPVTNPPSSTPTPAKPSPTPSPTPSIKPTATPTPGHTPTPTPVPTGTATATPTPSPTPTGPQILVSPNPRILTPPYDPSEQYSLAFFLVNGSQKTPLGASSITLISNTCTGTVAIVAEQFSYYWYASAGPSNGSCDASWATIPSPSLPAATGSVHVENQTH